ncbi:hypothetical protein Vretimale_16566 [Volvox reticuliferus]|uniref:tRNA (guanine(37)-N1)-methyltransferase n=1 Tax=Volvox reticuliferus TaxID=1737510 RepID=A0A8J4FX99_9CHLO|nr:hypothetical protein Vretifemale_17564 [Volvox reticuliferus]GIM13461.1 hypothetical protein Vretimale_16566 [Volvox reticuliferus]
MRFLVHQIYPVIVTNVGRLSRKLNVLTNAAGNLRTALRATNEFFAVRSRSDPSRLSPQIYRALTFDTNSMECGAVDTATANVAASPAPSTSGHEVPTLDREAFKQILNVIAIRVPNRKCADMMKAFRGFTLDRPRLRCIVQDGDRSETKLLLLEENVKLEDLPPELHDRFEADGLTVAATDHPVVLDYGMLSADAVLKRLLPAGVDAPSSFETIGHIAHLNLREEQLPFRHLIGAVLLDKNPHLKTVVNKVGSIENEFRVFQMEVIGGESRLETEVTQHGARFRLDFSQVYWNSRLESEHLRLVSSFRPGEVLVDMMAGIGPFAIPAAQKGLTVYANDLNPRSAHYLALNARLNRLGPSGLKVFNMDGRTFLRLLCDCPGSAAQELRAKLSPPPPEDGGGGGERSVAATDGGCTAVSGNPAKRQKTRARAAAEAAEAGPVPAVPDGFAPPVGGLSFDHVVMNLPASAIEFLDAFRGAFDPAYWEDRSLPLVHCYTFKRSAETEADIIAKAERYLGGPMESGSCSVHTVRDVAPNKLMLCLSFRVPREVAFKGRRE